MILILLWFFRYAADEYARKFGSSPVEENLTNEINSDEKPLAKEEGSLLTTVLELALKFVPALIDTLSGSTGPSQTDRSPTGTVRIYYFFNAVSNNI